MSFAVALTMKHLAMLGVVLAVVLGAGCMDSGDDLGNFPPPPQPQPLPPAKPHRMLIDGTVLDFTTGAPVAGATVDLGTAWGSEPHPRLVTTTTGADGRFGPIELATLGSDYVLFTVTGAGRTRTLSDNHECEGQLCTLTHRLVVPSSTLAAQWRSDLAAGGMPDAATRGLIAFQYQQPNSDVGSPGVVPYGLVDAGGDHPTERDLRGGPEVRFVGADRAALLPATQTSTSEAGVAVISADDSSLAFIGGKRQLEDWALTLCLVENGAIFLEDREESP